MPAVAIKPPYTVVLREDTDMESPRESEDCFGRMICFQNRYNLGDRHAYEAPEDFLRDLVESTVPPKAVIDYVLSGKPEGLELRYDEAGEAWEVRSCWDARTDSWDVVDTFSEIQGQEDDVACSLIEGLGTPDLLALAKEENCFLPLFLYDHSGLTMNTAGYSDKWDSGQVGWIYVTKGDVLAEYGGGAMTPELREKAEAILEAEVSHYDSYLRGECYGFQLYEDGAEVDSCWGFIGGLSDLQPDIEGYLPDGCRGIMDSLSYLGSDREVDDILREQNEPEPIYMEGDFIMSNQNNTGAPAVKLEARAYPIPEPKGNIMAFASVTINDCFAINGVKVMNGENGLFAAMPSMKDKNGEYRDVAFPTTPDLRKQLNSVVLDAYSAALEKGAKEQERPSAANKLNEAKKAAKAQAKTPKEPKAPKKSDVAL